MFKFLIGSGAAMALVVFSTLFTEPANFAAPEASQLSQTWGGIDGVSDGVVAAPACQDCKASVGGCYGDSCTKHPTVNVFIKVTGTLMTPMRCFTVAKGQPGGETCNSSTPLVCYSYKVCTDAACTNCGASTDVKKNSVCAVSGEWCTTPTTTTK